MESKIYSQEEIKEACDTIISCLEKMKNDTTELTEAEKRAYLNFIKVVNELDVEYMRETYERNLNESRK